MGRYLRFGLLALSATAASAQPERDVVADDSAIEMPEQMGSEPPVEWNWQSSQTPVFQPYQPFPPQPFPPQPVSGDSLVGDLAKYRERLVVECQRNPSHCSHVADLDDAIRAINDAFGRHERCRLVVEAYVIQYRNPLRDRNRHVVGQVAREFDIACLSSLEPRLGDLQIAVPAHLDPKMSSAVALLEDAVGPFCSGLIMGNRFVTALHCLERGRNGGAPDWPNLRIRPIDGRSSAGWRVGRPVKTGNERSSFTAEDWAILPIQTDEAIGAPAVVLETLGARPAAAITIGHYIDYAHTTYSGSAPAWRQSVRWPRDGLCQAIVVRDGCLQLFCQSTRGFSGAPIFRVRSSPSEPLAVIGFVSGPGDEPDVGCVPRLADSTAAVSARRIRIP